MLITKRMRKDPMLLILDRNKEMISERMKVRELRRRDVSKNGDRGKNLMGQENIFNSNGFSSLLGSIFRGH